MPQEPEEIRERIDRLREEIFTLREERSNLTQKAKELAERRNRLNAQFKELSQKIRNPKSSRDELNSKVRALKQERDKYQSQVEKERKRLEKLEEKFNALRSNVSGSVSKLRTEIGKLEWRIQTNPFSPKAEKGVIENIRKLESELAVHKRIEAFETKIIETKAKIGGLRIRAQRVHEELVRNAGESEKYHGELTAFAKQASEIKSQADSTHKSYVDALRAADECHIKLVEKTVQMRELRKQIATLGREQKASKEEAVRRKYEESASEKVQKGRKLSFEEFQVLMSKTGEKPE